MDCALVSKLKFITNKTVFFFFFNARGGHRTGAPSQSFVTTNSVLEALEVTQSHILGTNPQRQNNNKTHNLHMLLQIY